MTSSQMRCKHCTQLGYSYHNVINTCDANSV